MQTVLKNIAKTGFNIVKYAYLRNQQILKALT